MNRPNLLSRNEIASMQVNQKTPELNHIYTNGFIKGVIERLALEKTEAKDLQKKKLFHHH